MGAAIVGAVIASAITVAGGFALFYLLQRPRKQLGWRILSASVIIPRIRNPIPNIQITVQAKLLGQPGDQRIPIEEDILGFRVRIKNTGNDTIEDQTVTFSMSEGAKVLSIEPESQPNLGGREIITSVQDPTQNLATARLPYLNQSQEVIFSIQCLGELQTACSVGAAAPSLWVQDIEWANRLRLLCVFAVAAAAVLIGLGVARLLVETGDISDSSKDSIDSGLFLAGIISAIAVGSALLNLFTIRIDSPKAAEQAKKGLSFQLPRSRQNDEIVRHR